MAALEVASPSWLLVKTCQDLVGRAKSPELYAKLRMAGLLRHLLVGKHSLVDRVAAESGATFEFAFREPDDDHARWVSADGFDAARRIVAASPCTARRGAKADLLSSRLAHFGGWYSVEQLVSAVDHFYGGAPANLLEGVSHEAMRALDASVRSGSNDVPLALQELSGVVLVALLPIAKAHQPEGGVSAPRPAPIAPAGSGCPFSGKLGFD
jgi:hypothetical protein